MHAQKERNIAPPEKTVVRLISVSHVSRMRALTSKMNYSHQARAVRPHSVVLRSSDEA